LTHHDNIVFTMNQQGPDVIYKCRRLGQRRRGQV